MSIFTTLRDMVLGTTPQLVVQRALSRIEATEEEWEKIRRTLAPLPGYEATESARCIGARAMARSDMLAAIDDPRGESWALDCGRQMGRSEAEARCRIKEWLA